MKTIFSFLERKKEEISIAELKPNHHTQRKRKIGIDFVQQKKIRKKIIGKLRNLMCWRKSKKIVIYFFLNMNLALVAWKLNLIIIRFCQSSV